jgi:hypothetical protein
MKIEFDNCKTYKTPEMVQPEMWLRRMMDHAAMYLGIREREDVGIKVTVCHCALRRVARGATGPLKKPKNGFQYGMIVSPDQSMVEMLETTGHEMVHVRDMVVGKLTDPLDDKDGGVCWEGEYYPKSTIHQHQGTGDIKRIKDELPWEREAYRLQPEILHSFLETLTREELVQLAAAPRP